MIKSISYWSFEGGLDGSCPFERAVLQAKAAGFAGIEPAIATAGILTAKTDERSCQDYRSIAARHSIVVQTLASGMSWGSSPTHPDPAIRRQSIDLHREALKRAAWIGAQAMLFVPGAITIPWDPSYPAVPYDQAYRWAGEAVSELLQTAEAVGVDLCVENVWNGLFYSPLELAGFVDQFKSKRVGVYFDVGNVLGYHQHPQHWASILGQRIKRVHIKDFKRAVGNLSGFCDLLEGDVPWKETIHALRQNGYDKTIVAEMIPPTPGILERTSAAMDRILAM